MKNVATVSSEEAFTFNEHSEARQGTVVIDLREGLPARELHERLAFVHRLGESANRALAFFLSDMQERGIHVATGDASAAEYAANKLRMSPRRARELIQVGRALIDLDRIDAAFRDGDLSWSQARLLARVAVPETQKVWLERAKGRTAEELRREIRDSQRGDLPSDKEGGLPRPRTTVRGRFTWQQTEVWEKAREKLMAELGESVTDGEMMQQLALLLLETGADGVPEGRHRVDDSLYRFSLLQCPGCETFTLHTKEGPVEPDPGTVESILSDARREGEAPTSRSDAPTEDPPRDSMTPPRLHVLLGSHERAEPQDAAPRKPESDGAEPEIHVDAPTSPRLRRAVLARDDYQCKCCRSRHGLMVHHIHWRSRGGRTVQPNLVCLCSPCHGRVHEELLMVKGSAPHHVEFLDRLDRPLASSPSGERGTRLTVHEERGAAAPPSDPFNTGSRLGESDGAAAPQDPVSPGCFPPLDDAGGRALESDLDSQPPVQVTLDADRRATSSQGGTASGPLTGRTDGAAAPREAVAGAEGSRAAASCARVSGVAQLPSHVDSVWWKHHAHLIRWNRQAGVMELSPGRARQLPRPEGEGRTSDCPTTREPAEPELVTLENFVGQPRVAASLREAVLAAKIRGWQLGHVLLSGPAGLGKSTLAAATAREQGGRLLQTSAPMLKDPGVLIELVAGLQSGDVLFLDEIHALSRPVAETLYEAMQDQCINLPITDGIDTRTVHLQLAPFTTIGATTELGELPEPLKARFHLREHLDFYDIDALAEIVCAQAVRDDMEISSDAARVIAGASRGTPREACRLLRRVIDHNVTRGRNNIVAVDVIETLGDLGIDLGGAGPVDRQIVDLLRRHRGAVGLRQLLSLLGMPRKTYLRDHEPFLLRSGLIAVTPLGRVAVG